MQISKKHVADLPKGSEDKTHTVDRGVLKTSCLNMKIWLLGVYLLLRKDEVFAHAGLISNLKDLKKTRICEIRRSSFYDSFSPS